MSEFPVVDSWSTLKSKPKSKPYWTTVYRWATALRDSSQSPTSLITDHRAKGNRSSRYPQEVLRICEDVIQSTYLTPERPTTEHTLHIAQAEVRRENSLRPRGATLPLPSRRLIEGLIEKVPAFDRYAARYGRDAARKRFRSVLGYRLTTAPLEYAEIDHTRMDVFAIDDETGIPLGRPWLIALLDNHSRYILGFNLGFEPPSRATVAKCLRHAFMPKTGLRTEYPDLKNDWVGFGVIRKIGMDNGLEFHSDDLENVCLELDIEQHFAPRKEAWFKGKIERFQGTLNREVTATTPGKTFSSIFERDDYDPQKHAIVGISQLRHLIIRWIVDVYHQRTHKALDCSPHAMWTSSIRTEDIPLIDCPLQFDAIMGDFVNDCFNRLLTRWNSEGCARKQQPEFRCLLLRRRQLRDGCRGGLLLSSRDSSGRVWEDELSQKKSGVSSSRTRAWICLVLRTRLLVSYAFKGCNASCPFLWCRIALEQTAEGVVCLPYILPCQLSISTEQRR